MIFSRASDRVCPRPMVHIARLAAACAFCAISLGTPLNSSFTEAIDDARTLQPGERIHAEITAAGTIDRYLLSASRGQYVHIVVEEASSALRLTLLDAGARKLRDRVPAGPGVPVELGWIPDTDAQLVVEVSHRQKGASIAVPYEIRLEMLRPATAPEVTRFSAMRLLDEARALGGSDSEQAWREATGKCERAAALFEELGDLKAEANALGLAGGYHNMVGEVGEALDVWKRSLALARTAGDAGEEGWALHRVGTALMRLGDYQDGLDAYIRALDIWRTIGNRDGEANALGFLGNAYSSLGDHRSALDHLQQVAAILRSLGRESAEFNLRFSIAEEHALLGQKQKALEVYTQYIRDCRTAGESCGGKLGEALARQSAGRLAAEMGDYSRALQDLNAALAIYASSPIRRGQPTTLCQLGFVYARLNERAKAVECLDKALELMPPVPNRADRTMADFLRDAGEAYRLAGATEKALQCFERRLAETGASGPGRSRAESLALVATAEHDLGKLDDARKHTEEALAIIERIRTGIVSPAQRSTYFSSYRDYYDLYVQLLMEGGMDAAAFAASENARARSLLELLAEGRIDIRQGIDPKLLEEERSLRRQINARENWRQALMQRKDGQEQVAAAATEVQRLTVEQDRLEARIRSASPRYTALTQPRPLDLEQVQEKVLDDDTLLLEYLLGSDQSYVWAVSRNAQVSFPLTKKSEIDVRARRLYDLLSRRGGAATATPQARLHEAALALSRIVLEPAAGLLQKRRLVIVADGMLQYVPFAALPDPNHRDRPLAASHEVVHAPSASVLHLLRADRALSRSGSGVLAVLADPVFEVSDPRVKAALAATPESTRAGHLHASLRSAGVESVDGRITRLPFSRREADSILALSSASDELRAVDFEASRATATAPQLAQYRIVHFATHAVLNGEVPALSGLVLSLVDERGDAQDGFLRLQDIFNLNLPADLVVLSACRTALGKDERGEGIVGLTRGFLYAGAARVVASLWKVDDVATAQLMTRFYEGMLRKKLRPAAALRAAQLEMYRTPRWRDPFYWAGFVLQGTWK